MNNSIKIIGTLNKNIDSLILNRNEYQVNYACNDCINRKFVFDGIGKTVSGRVIQAYQNNTQGYVILEYNNMSSQQRFINEDILPYFKEYEIKENEMKD